MPILPRKKTHCGYSYRYFLKSPDIAQNIKSIQAKTNVKGTPVKSIIYEDFDKQAIDVKSEYNPDTVRILSTQLDKKETFVAVPETFVPPCKDFDNVLPGPETPTVYHYNETTVTQSEEPLKKDLSSTALVSNITFGDKTIQFLCVDGTNLQSYQFEDPSTIVRMVNSGQLSPVIIEDLENISTNQMTIVDAYAGSIWDCMFLWEVLGKKGIIDDSHVILSVVNVPMANAFWNSHYMTYGSGKESGAPSDMGPLTSMDICAHELGHSVIEAAGNIDYQGESGALNEAIADIFGTCLEKYFDIRADRKLFDFKIGEDIFGKVGKRALRDMSRPKDFGQPDTYKGEKWFDTQQEEDQGGVHVNSGVINYWYYCLATGKKGTNDFGVNYDIKDSFEMFKLTQLIHLSLKGEHGYQKIKSTFTFLEFANCILNNVNKFLTDNKMDIKLADSVLEAFIAVGIKTRKDGEHEPVPEEPTPPVPEEPTPPVPEEPIPPAPAPPAPTPWPIPPWNPPPNPWPWNPLPQEPTPWPMPQEPNWPLPQEPNWPTPFPFPVPHHHHFSNPFRDAFDWIRSKIPFSSHYHAIQPGCGQLITYQKPQTFRTVLSNVKTIIKAKFGFFRK